MQAMMIVVALVCWWSEGTRKALMTTSRAALYQDACVVVWCEGGVEASCASCLAALIKIHADTAFSSLSPSLPLICCSTFACIFIPPTV